MEKKSITISSLGLKNVIFVQNHDEDFTFIFGEQELRINSFFADFISPVVSRLHQTDPTIKSINLGELITSKTNELIKLSKTIATPEIFSLLRQISSGFSIEIDEDQAIKMQFLSTILGNEELYTKLNDLYPTKCTEKNVNTYLKNFQFLYNFSKFSSDFDFSSLVSSIASNFYALDEYEFLKLPRKIQYMIISHPHLQIKSEDSLLDIVSQIIESQKKRR